ncbi:SDR family NAD(P)-dependent oxidoreductase [Legionella waltersii]|uniref:3-oxoacyl-ACP reductase n=1 Tax=Legionella waltersii TaxID=66969 RepID=A0A0W0ZZV4_9GAMM|nr:SDR family oxidoreductase [Legionella waltersii]KTD74619.1 3-oxoacyl-ACP reductase [Legionella waltersii]SNV08838.1 3-oxoacyl-ACP reductase [Legionella waltersii]
MNLLITGGSSDIAMAIAKRRMELGDRIVITCSNQDSLQQTLETYKKRGMAVRGFIYHFANPEASDQEIAEVLAEPLHGVVFNAFTRVNQLRKLHALPYASIQKYLNENLQGNIWLIHKLLPHFLKNQFGRVILISSLSAITGTSRYPMYCAAKAALEGLFFNLAVDYSADNILSNIVRVGLIKTSRTEQFWKNASYQEKVANLIPQGTMGEPAQIAEAIDPLLSPTSFITGSVLTVSGGLPLVRSEGVLS